MASHSNVASSWRELPSVSHRRTNRQPGQPGSTGRTARWLDFVTGMHVRRTFAVPNGSVSRRSGRRIQRRLKVCSQSSTTPTRSRQGRIQGRAGWLAIFAGRAAAYRIDTLPRQPWLTERNACASPTRASVPSDPVPATPTPCPVDDQSRAIMQVSTTHNTTWFSPCRGQRFREQPVTTCRPCARDMALTITGTSRRDVHLVRPGAERFPRRTLSGLRTRRFDTIAATSSEEIGALAISGLLLSQ